MENIINDKLKVEIGPRRKRDIEFLLQIVINLKKNLIGNQNLII